LKETNWIFKISSNLVDFSFWSLALLLVWKLNTFKIDVIFSSGIIYIYFRLILSCMVSNLCVVWHKWTNFCSFPWPNLNTSSEPSIFSSCLDISFIMHQVLKDFRICFRASTTLIWVLCWWHSLLLTINRKHTAISPQNEAFRVTQG
jgi:hypothetical protein